MIGDVGEALTAAPPLADWIAAGEVTVRGLDEVYGDPWLGDPEASQAAFARALDQALAEGYQGLRGVAFLSDLLAEPQMRPRVTRWEHWVGRWQSERPVATMCVYHRQAGEQRHLAVIACLHPRVETPPEITSFRLFWRQGELTLAGEVDLFAAPYLEEALRYVETAGKELVIEASGLRFIDHRGVIALVEGFARERGTRVVLRNSPPATGRILEVLGIDERELALT